MIMRALYCLPVLAALAGCKSDNAIEPVPTEVEWMEWPAEVTAATPFTVRLLVPWPFCLDLVGPLNLGTSTDESAVTFAPYFPVNKHEVCPPGVALPYHNALDTVATVAALAASVPRIVGMRGASYGIAPPPDAHLLPLTFGTLAVRLSDPDTSRRNAAGVANKGRDNLGCVRLGPADTHDPGLRYVLDDQADTTTFWSKFVRGYIHESATPVCGETRLFHIEARY